MVLTVSFALFPVTGLVCHRHLAFTAKLDASVGASEPHDYAVRLTCCSSKASSASTASRPAFVTIAIRPSLGRDGATNEVICFGEERKCFCKWDWTGQIRLIRFNKFRCARTRCILPAMGISVISWVVPLLS